MSDIRWELLLPKPERMLSLLIENPFYYLDAWWGTFSIAAIASLLALVFAVFFSILSLQFKVLRYIFTPLVTISQSFPLQAIAPIILIVFGTGFFSLVVVAFVIAFFPIYGACSTALLSTPTPLLAYLSVCHTSFMKSVWYVRIPSSLPAIISSAKVGFTLAVLGAVVAEFIQPSKGLGELLMIAQSSFDMEMIYICITFLVIQGLAVYGLLGVFESYILKKRSF